MVNNKPIMASNQLENIKQLVKNYIASLLRVLENENENTNILKFMDPIVEVHARVIDESLYQPNSENSYNARIQEFKEELNSLFFGLNVESFEKIFQQAYELAVQSRLQSRQSDLKFMVNFMQKFLEVETALNYVGQWSLCIL